jgi:hypothetical protein
MAFIFQPTAEQLCTKNVDEIVDNLFNPAREASVARLGDVRSVFEQPGLSGLQSKRELDTA